MIFLKVNLVLVLWRSLFLFSFSTKWVASQAYLSPADFKAAFSKAGVAGGPGPATYADFTAIAPWKQKQLREKAKLL